MPRRRPIFSRRQSVEKNACGHQGNVSLKAKATRSRKASATQNQTIASRSRSSPQRPFRPQSPSFRFEQAENRPRIVRLQEDLVQSETGVARASGAASRDTSEQIRAGLRKKSYPSSRQARKSVAKSVLPTVAPPPAKPAAAP